MSVTRLCTSGHVASAHELIAMGASRGQISRAVATGRLVRARQGVYVCPHLTGELLRAATVGGALTCVTVLRMQDVWAGNSPELHLQVPPTSSQRLAPGVRLHWEVPHFDMTSNWVAGRMQALWQAIRCLDEENAIAALESAITTKFLTALQVRQICELAPSRLADGIDRMVTNSGSGLETIARLRLQRLGHTVQSQAKVPGLGHQDLLVDDFLALEIDGKKWHTGTQFDVDRDRDLHAARLGRRTLRLTARQVLSDWPDTLSAIERVLSDSEPAQHRGAFRNTPTGRAS